MRIKKHKVLTAVFTRRGLVHVRCTGREGVFSINSMEELSSINHSPDPLSTTLRLDLKLIAFVFQLINCILLIKIGLKIVHFKKFITYGLNIEIAPLIIIDNNNAG